MPPLPRLLLRGAKPAATQVSKKVNPGLGVLTKEDTIKNIRLNTEAENAAAINRIMARQGTGTMLDLPIAGVRAIPPVKNKLLPNDRYKKILNSYQVRLNHADRAAGEYLANRGKIFKSLFTSEDLLPKGKVITDSGKKVDAYVPTQVSRLSAPLDKTKHFVIPMLAVLGLDSIYENAKANNENANIKEGDFPVPKQAEIREALIDKIASTISTMNKPETGVEKAAAQELFMEKIAAASELLKLAHTKIASLEDEVQELRDERDRLQLQITAKERSQRAVKLARDMLNRGMIKKAELKEQEDYIMSLNDENYNLLVKTVENVPLKQASTVQNGLDKVSYIVAEGFEDEPERPSLGEAIIHFAKTI